MSSSFGWECSHCTFKHAAPGTRCAMCNQLRVTKEQMRDFVAGKTLPKKQSDNVANKEANNTTTKENRPPPPPPPPPASIPKAAPVVRNPYAKKTNTTTAAATAPTKPPPPSNGMPSSVMFGHPGAAASTSVARHPQQPQIHSTSAWAPQGAGTVNGNAAIGNNSLPRPGSSSAIGQQHGPARQALPMKHPPSAAGYPAQSRGQQSNASTGSRRPVQPTNLKPAPDAQQKQNPFTLARRPPPIQYVPGPVPLCMETASDWIYPVHEAYPIRDYQLEISSTAVMYNTLVSLPTGLGKTLIASVVLYNFYRWFPTGKVIFLAPTLPLVNQQVKACYDIMGIPTEDTAMLTGKVAAKDREGLWHERRVFFCTPQTVQKDIESGKCPGRQVVCLVLDEAHKATGAYAYVKVIQHLEEAGAKFRILGLSATPGTNIKSIQEVVTALRIQKIEARLENDASIKKYVHERHSEIVLVKQGSVVTTVERMLMDLVAPVLERLRGGNGMVMIRGNATLTPYCIIRAMEDYHRRTNDHGLDPYFYAAQSLVQARADIRRNGIGMVRTRMLQLRNQPKGIMCTIVRGKEFQAVMDAVLRASGDPNNINELAEDRKLNNPKLMKLDEILTEHFERERACGNSSRAIVFTQWRDSVSEIVAVLSSHQPLLRARHFVGQGKSSGGANKERVDQSCASLKGMKQKEQQQAIREFREGKYNILVCTCIGEEGLDIGEVDLIVNFDSLRSPIRMIQRVGRTGRKRDGRVVCLVSEGQEENTMRQSQTAEKTLGRALKKSDAFRVVRGAPMFPQAPTLRKLDMSIAQDFHMSQIGGNKVSSKKNRRDPSDADKVPLSTNWKLTDAQESHREAMFGDLAFSTSHDLRSSNGQMPEPLQKRLLRARTRSISTYENRRKPVPASFGVSRGILLKLERKHGKEVDGRALFNNGGSSRSRRESGALQQLFPLERSEEVESLDRGLLKMSLTVQETSSSAPQDEGTIDMDTREASPSLPLRLHESGSNQNQDSVRVLPDCDKNVAGAGRPQNPYFSQTESRSRRSDQNVAQTQQDIVQTNVAVNAEVPSGNAACIQDIPTESEQFHLPTPPATPPSEDSGSEDDSIEENSQADRCDPRSVNAQVDAASQQAAADRPSILSPKIASEQQERPDLSLPAQLDDTMKEDALRLPTQESSSEDDSSDEESDDDESTHVPPSKKEIFVPPAEINVDHTMAETDASIQGSRKEDDEPGAKARSHPNRPEHFAVQEEHPGTQSHMLVDKPDGNGQTPSVVRPPLATTLSSEATPLGAPRSSSHGDALLVDTPPFVASPLATPCASADSGADLIDTPSQCQDTGQMLPPPARTMSGHDSQCTASNVDADEVVCAICFDGASPENNPIVLCDGPNNDHTCPVAVHKLCYSINGSLEDVDNWYCDVCSFRQQRQSKKRSTMQCFVCQKEDGPLKEMPDCAGKSWFHPHCRYAVVDENSCCQYCASKGGTRCASEGCTEYAHPHCGLALESPWLVVAYAASVTASSSLSSDQVIGCNIYCQQHRDQVSQALVRAGIDASDASSFPRYVIVSSKLRDLNAGTGPTGAAQRKRLRKKSKVNTSEGRAKLVASDKSMDEGVESADVREAKRQRVLQRMKERADGMKRCRFIEDEVADSDEDEDGDYGEEDEARRIEQEERFHEEFINDTSQLGSLTQDPLGQLGLSENAEAPSESVAVHRRVDVMREKRNQYATPVFNRRMRKHGRGRENDSPGSSSQAWDQPTPASEPSSQKGLGNMHFVRSVLEHHRNGGDADDIEAMYHSVAQEASPLAEEPPTPRSNPPGRIEMPYVPSDSEDDEEEETQATVHQATASGATNVAPPPRPPSSANAQVQQAPGVLTAEQRALIERKRQEALRRRQQHQSSSKTS